MKKGIALILLVILLLSLTGCGGDGEPKVYQRTYTDVFDTVLFVSRYTDDVSVFKSEADQIYQALMSYHRAFDIYNNYAGMNNLKTVNDKAGVEPVKVDKPVIELLLDCREYYEVTGGRMNAAMGSILKLWHDAREQGVNDPANAKLPDRTALEEAAKHCSWDTIIIDEENCTVFITDPAQSLDVGAIAKGWAVQKIAEQAGKGVMINLGGNVCATGPKNSDGDSWTVGVNEPGKEGSYLCKVGVTTGSAVTSGDYLRKYTVDGVDYHHIIDSQTLMPATLWRSVTILCDDSGVADMLSTALFLMDQLQGQALLEQYGAVAMWVDHDGNCHYSSGFEERLKD